MMSKSTVYTRRGDHGQTSLVGGERVSKCCARIESYGTIDELNSLLGLLIAEMGETADVEFLRDVQNHLFIVGANLATDTSHVSLRPQSCVTDAMVRAVEREIDEIDGSLPPLRLFVLPGGTHAAAVCHVCRTVCRRAERRILALAEEASVDPLVLSYVNRLSDFFFVLARKLNVTAGTSEIFWKQQQK